ncbi:MAG TPA: hypothetical protein VGZ27_03115 [Vicinamibacterales bacterium]|nr:hypothetical protein [Vicinamibacterales bacterium]
MNASTLGLLGLLAAQFAPPPKFTVPAVPDVTIKTRQTTDHQNSSISTTIVYRKGARQRTETIVDWPPQVSARNGSRRTHIGTSIIQCDERRTAVLNDDAKTYAYSPIEDPSVYLQRARLAAGQHPQPEPTGGDVTVTIDMVDTGERRAMGRYVARRVITTTKTEPGPGASAPASESTQDGWYIDWPSANCWDLGDLPEPFLFTIAQRSNAPRDRVHITRLGTARRGYPIQETNRSKDERGTTTSTLELIEFSDAPLDAALFAVPADYRPVLPNPFGRYDLTKPDTLMNRLHSYWDGLREWAGGRLRTTLELWQRARDRVKP